MSLVNLSHVCSHLQNASLARLGLTSIPYTKLHLSLSLLLHKQGFLSQVKIGGLSPPASCFPGTVPNNDVVSAQPHADRSPVGSSSALTELVVNGKREEDLRAAGFGKEEIDFALAQMELDGEQLVKDGWDTVAIDFLLQHGLATPDELTEMQLDQPAMQILAKYNVREMAQAITDEQFSSGSSESASAESGTVSVSRDSLQDPELVLRLRSQLYTQGIETDDLKYFAGDQKYTKPRHLARDGVTMQAMGLAVKDQAFTQISEEYRDPWQLDEEGVVTQANRASRRLWLGLKYWQGKPVLTKARMLSKPTKRIWLNHRDLGRIVRGNRAGEIKPVTQIGEIVAVCTDRGVLEARECVERKIGGMVLCRVW